MNDLKNDLENVTYDLSSASKAINNIVYRIKNRYKDDITSSEWNGIMKSDEMLNALSEIQLCRELMGRFEEAILI